MLNPSALDLIQTAGIVATVIVMAWTTRRQLRAYLGVSMRWRHGELDSNQQCSVDKHGQYVTGVFVTNHGLTPARAVSLKATLEVLPATLPPDALYSALSRAQEHAINAAPRVANPGNSLPLFYQVSGGNAASGVTPNERLYLFGEVRYRDVFDSDRSTRFAAYLDDSSTTGSLWVTASQHNDTE